MVRFRGYREDADVASFDLVHLRRLWPFVRPYRRAFGLCLLILLASFGLEVLGPVLVKLAIDGPIAAAIAGRPLGADLWWLAGAYLAATVAGVGLGYAYGWLTAYNGQRVVRDVRQALFGHLMQLGPRFYDRNPAGKLVTRAVADVENLNELIATGVLQTLFDLLKLVGILAILFAIEPHLALFTLIATPAVIGLSLLFRKFARESYGHVRGRIARQNAFCAEAIGGVRIGRLFGRSEEIVAHHAELNADTKRAWLRTVLAFSLFFSAIDLAFYLTQVGILGLGGGRILAGTLTAGAFVQFWLYFGKLTEPIRQLGEKYNVLQSAFASSDRIFKILAEPVRPPRAAAPRPAGRGPAQLEFEAVSFEYDPGTPVLRGVTFTAEAGQTTAIVGPTGAGKSTILALACRLYDPTAGAVRIDGAPLPDLDLDALRARIAVVPQDVFLFTGTVLDNVRLFDETIDAARVQDALAAVGAADFVAALDGGLSAEVQERGATFSQGERQLLAFARALVRDPDVLILDEATANVDTQTEARIQRGLRELLRGRTAIVVAHRLSTVRDADRILVVRDGRIVEAGRHAELVRAGGVYAGMVAEA